MATLLLGPASGSIPLFPVTVSLSLVGALIAARTGNRMGWLFLADGLALALALAAKAYASAPRPGAAWAGGAFTLGLEAGTPLSFLVPLTRSGGLLLVSSFLGGAIAKHLLHGKSIAQPSFVLALVWVGAWLRHPAMLWSFTSGGQEDRRVGQPGTINVRGS